MVTKHSVFFLIALLTVHYSAFGSATKAKGGAGATTRTELRVKLPQLGGGANPKADREKEDAEKRNERPDETSPVAAATSKTANAAASVTPAPTPANSPTSTSATPAPQPTAAPASAVLSAAASAALAATSAADAKAVAEKGFEAKPAAEGKPAPNVNRDETSWGYWLKKQPLVGSTPEQILINDLMTLAEIPLETTFITEQPLDVKKLTANIKPGTKFSVAEQHQAEHFVNVQKSVRNIQKQNNIEAAARILILGSVLEMPMQKESRRALRTLFDEHMKRHVSEADSEYDAFVREEQKRHAEFQAKAKQIKTSRSHKVAQLQILRDVTSEIGEFPSPKAANVYKFADDAAIDGASIASLRGVEPNKFAVLAPRS